ncbi:MAG: PepSY domain-containing protein [Acidobacteria bacterium]|nr:PepSY domain-containing protein [Acidobacteriota bacterium]
MTKWIKKVHMYTGLLNFTMLLIFAAVGISSTFLPEPKQRPRPQAQVRYVEFASPGNLSDRELADHLHKTLNLPLTRPSPNGGIRRNTQNELEVDFFTPAKRYLATILEKESRVRIEEIRFDTWQFASYLHELTPSKAAPHWPTRLWGFYVELSAWSLITMALSGVYLWASTSRRRTRWAKISLVAGIGGLILFYKLIR